MLCGMVCCVACCVVCCVVWYAVWHAAISFLSAFFQWFLLHLAAYFPVIHSGDEVNKNDDKQWREAMFHQCLTIVFGKEFLQAQYAGIEVSTYAGKKFKGLPIIGLWVADNPEKHVISLIGHSGCTNCLDPMSAFNDITSDLVLRDKRVHFKVYKKALKEWKKKTPVGDKKCHKLMKESGMTINGTQTKPLQPILNATWVWR